MVSVEILFKGGSKEMIKPFQIFDEIRDMSWFIPVDEKLLGLNEEDIIFVMKDNYLFLNVTDLCHVDLTLNPEKADLNAFLISPKRCYNGKEMREHLPKYLNYFEKYYDTDHELVMAMANIKCKIDLVPSYTEQQFIFDVCRLILSPSIRNKAILMNEDNYVNMFDDKAYRNDKNEALIYKDKHVKYMMWMSLLMNICIPVITHYIYHNNIPTTNEFILKIFRIIVSLTEVNIYNKLYETSYSNVSKNATRHERLWAKQDIRGKNVTTHSLECIDNIILNIMPKYTYTKNAVSFNFTSIRLSNNYQVTGNPYEYDYVPLSSSIRDSDNNSVYDKFESYITKQSEAKYLINKVISEETVRELILRFGPITDDEIAYYNYKLADENGEIKNPFQQKLIALLFYKYFGDPVGWNNINSDDYVKLLIIAYRLLKANNFIVLPYVISSKIDRLQYKKSINKSEAAIFAASQTFDIITAIYNSEDIVDDVLSIIGTILASKFKMIDFYDRDIDGKYLDKNSLFDIIIDEIGKYIILIQ